MQRVIKLNKKAKVRGLSAVACAMEPIESRIMFAVGTIDKWTFETSVPTTAGPFAPEINLAGATTAAGFGAKGVHVGAAAFSTPVGNGSGHSYSANVWAVGDAWDFSTNSINQTITSFSFDQGTSTTGPKDWKVQYSTDGTNFTDLPSGSYSLSNSQFSSGTLNAALTHTFDVSSIPTLSGQSKIAFRIVDTSTNGASGGTVASTGTDRVDNVTITGSLNAPGAPQFSGFSASPSSIGTGSNTPVTLTATGVQESPGNTTIQTIKFYREATNGTQNPSVDTLVDTQTVVSGTTTYTSVVNTNGFAAGTYTYYAVGTDDANTTTNSTASAFTVVNLPFVNIVNTPYTITETPGTDQTITVSVTLSSAPTANATVNYSTSDGAHFTDPANTNVDGGAVAGRDYTSTTGVLTFTPTGPLTQTFTVPILGVKTFAGTRKFNVNLTATNSNAILGTTISTPVTITDVTFTAPNGVATSTGGATTTWQLTDTGQTSQNSFINIAASTATTTGFGNSNTQGPVIPFIEFSNASSVFPTTYQGQTIDSLKLSIYNVNNTPGNLFNGHAGSFDLYILTADADAAGAQPTYKFLLNGNTAATGNTGSTVIGTQGTPALVGSATFTDNVAGYNDFIFDGLASKSAVQSALLASTNSGAPLRFIIVPSSGSAATAIAADWAGANPAFANEIPQLSLLTEKSNTIVEAIKLDTASQTATRGATSSTFTIQVDRSGTNLGDSAQVNYTATDITTVAGTDYSIGSSTAVAPATSTTGTITFAPGDTSELVTITLPANAISGDKTFKFTLSSPTILGAPGTPPHAAVLTAPTVETVTIHDSRTQNYTIQAEQTVTVGQTGPVPTGTSGHDFIQVEGTTAGTLSGGTAPTKASYGVADFDVNGDTVLPTPGSDPIAQINSLSLATVNSLSGFKSNGVVNVYFVTDNSGLSFTDTAPFFDTTTTDGSGLNSSQLGTHYLLGSYTYTTTQSTSSFTANPLLTTNAAAMNAIISALNGNTQFRLVLTPGGTTTQAASTAAPYVGDLVITIDGVPSQFGEPKLLINYTTQSNLPSIPAWLDPASAATYNFGTHSLVLHAGTSTIIGNPGADAPVITEDGTATLVVNTAASGGDNSRVISLGGLTLSSSSTVSLTAASSHSLHRILVTPSLTIGAGSTIDVKDNDILVSGGAASLGTLTAAVKSGFNSGGAYWAGTGIKSSTAAADTSFLSSVGIASGVTTTDAGQAVATGDVLIRYTYYGDADLSGGVAATPGFGSTTVVTGNDYSLIDFAYTHPNQLSGWQNGDFNYDGKIDGSDYTLMDNAFNRQGASLASAPAAEVATFSDTPVLKAMSASPASVVDSSDLFKDKKSLADVIFAG